MLENKPLYLVTVCSNCVAIRHFKPKDNGSNIYSCPVCGFEIEYGNGVITKVVVSIPGSPEAGYERMARNPYGRKGRPR